MTYIYIYLYIPVYMHMCICIHIHIYICIYICIYIYIYTHIIMDYSRSYDRLSVVPLLAGGGMFETGAGRGRRASGGGCLTGSDWNGALVGIYGP